MLSFKEINPYYEKVTLIGMMGTGKSKFGRQIAKILKFNFYDVDYMIEKKDYLMSQIGNPDGSDVPNKKFYDPRVWLRKGEQTFKSRLIKAFEDLNNINTLD